MLKWIILAVVILALIALVLANIRVVPQSKAFVLERLGTFYATWQTGLHVKIPLTGLPRPFLLRSRWLTLSPRR